MWQLIYAIQGSRGKYSGGPALCGRKVRAAPIMCGIAGFLNLDGAPAAFGTVSQMADLQRHRGPDDHGIRLFSLSHGHLDRAGAR